MMAEMVLLLIRVMMFQTERDANQTDCTLALYQRFVTFNQSYLHYLWHVLDKHDLTRSSIKLLLYYVSKSNNQKKAPSIFDKKLERNDFTPKSATNQR